MKKHVSLAVCLAIGLAAGAARIAAQNVPHPTYIPAIKFDAGREVVPYLEGWIRNPDGSFDFVFGYYNRNTVQELVIPPGPDNMVSPGPADQGQPTYFMAKRQFRVFRVRVPKDWGDKALTWSVTANGSTQKVVAKLVPAYEKDERFIETNNQTGTSFGVTDVNTKPTLTLAPIGPARANEPVTLAAQVTDDGLPKPRVVKTDDPDRPQEQTSADPLARFRSQRNTSGGRPQGLRVLWQVYRGPGAAKLEAYQIPVEGGKAVTAARFSEPGEYTLIATATDTKLIASQRVTVTVR